MLKFSLTGYPIRVHHGQPTVHLRLDAQLRSTKYREFIIGGKETWQRIFDKYVMMVTGTEATIA